MEKELQEIGLNPNETKVYLSILKLGEATANRISSLSEIARSTTYDALEKLKQKGFLKSITKDKKIHFIAIEPKNILSLFDEEKKEFSKEIEAKKQKYSSILEKLENIHDKVKQKPSATVYEGKRSISQILDEISDRAKELLIIGSQKNAEKIIEYRTDRFRTKRKSKRSKVRQILEESLESRREKIDKFTQVRFLKSLEESRDATFIYGDVVVHIILAEEISAIKIVNPEYANSQRIIFEEIWGIAKR